MAAWCEQYDLASADGKVRIARVGEQQVTSLKRVFAEDGVILEVSASYKGLDNVLVAAKAAAQAAAVQSTENLIQ
jgi:hypothetical protein